MRASMRVLIAIVALVAVSTLVQAVEMETVSEYVDTLETAFVEQLPTPGKPCGPNGAGTCSAQANWCGTRRPVTGQCAGSAVCCTPQAAPTCAYRCQARSLPCGAAYVPGLCGSGSNVCCPRAPAAAVTPVAPRPATPVAPVPATRPTTCAYRCQVRSLPCGAAYVPGLCGSGANVCCPVAPPAANPSTFGAAVVHTTEGERGTFQVPADIMSPSRQAPVDADSERRIRSLHPRFQPYARAFVNEAKAAGYDMRITQGHRTYQEQNDLYAKGRTTAGPRVTNARGGYSNHNFGTAIDVSVYINGRYIDNDRAYQRTQATRFGAIAVIGKRLGLEWGGDWTSMVDMPHFQLRPSWARNMRERAMIDEFRRRKAAGIDLYQ